MRALHVKNDWLLSASLLAELAVGASDSERADALYRRLARFEGLTVDTEEVSTGAVGRYLGLLAAVTDRPSEAATRPVRSCASYACATAARGSSCSAGTVGAAIA